MDLNLLYARQQIALIQASTAATDPERARHLKRASGLASRISLYQRAHGAAAGGSWRDAAMIGEGAAH